MDIQNILIRLQEKGMTQEQIASELGCKQPTVSQIKSGQIGKKRPSHQIVEGLKRLAKKMAVCDVPQKKRSRRSTDKKAP